MVQVHAAFHNITAMVGAGVLGLPNAMVRILVTAVSTNTSVCSNMRLAFH